MKVRSYSRKPYRLGNKVVHPGKTGEYNRKQRPEAKKRFVAKKPTKLYAVYDQYHQRRGWVRRR